LTKEVKPWWDYIEDVKYNGYWEPDLTFIAPYIVKQSVNHKLPFLFGSKKGEWKVSEKKILKEICSKAKALGGFSHYEKYNDYYKQVQDYTFLWADAILCVEILDSNIRFCTSNRTLYKEFTKLGQDLLKETESKPEGKVYALVPNGNGGLTSSSLGVGASPLIEENYTPDAIEGYKQVLSDLRSQDPIGALAILAGPPGTGKTHLIRSLLHDCPELRFLILPANVVSEMSGPALLQALINEAEDPCDTPYGFDLSKKDEKRTKPLVLIIEDADECLTVRDRENISSTATLLNATDGILGKCLNLRIICTTNAEIEEFDPAILRPGRLSAKVEVGLLDREQATKIYKRLGGKGKPNWEDKFLPLSSVYAKYKGEKINKDIKPIEKAKNKIGFAT